jgi:hypothetical protein
MSPPIVTVPRGGWSLPRRARPAPGSACALARHAGSRIADPSTVENLLWRVRFASVTITYTYT